MEPLDAATRQAFKATLEELLRPREEIIEHQKAHEEILSQSYGENILKHPLALLPSDLDIPQTDKTSSSRLEELIDTNVRLNKELRQLQEASRTSHEAPDQHTHNGSRRPASTVPITQDSDVIALQLQVNALEEKRSRLSIFLDALDNLETLPAADPDYIHLSSTTGTNGSGGMFEHCSPLPEMPKELMEGFTRDTLAPQHEIETMMQGLHKAVLRNKLLAQREKRKLDTLRREKGGDSGDMNDPSSLPEDVQLHALSAVKDHLISWIETQLMQAGDEDEGEDGGGSAEQNTLSNSAGRNGHDDEGVDLDTKLGEIQRQYDNHIALRRDIGSLLAEADQVSHDLEKFKGMRITASSPNDATADVPSPTAQGLSTNLNPPTTLILTPYLERLQQASREQKALVQEKSHINSTIAKQQQHMAQTIQELVEASHLLGAYPNADPSNSNSNSNSSRRSTSRTRSSFGDATRRSGSRNKASVATQVEPFVYSADSAKIATLEAVVEKIELGQMAVEEARGRLDEVRRFLDKPDHGEEPASAPSGHRRRNTEGVIIIEERSIWSKLDGNLGLIND